MRAMVRSSGPANPADAPIGLLRGLARFAVGGLLVRDDHSHSHVSLVGDPSGGVDSVEHSGRRLLRGEQQSIQGPGEVSVMALTARETVGCDTPGNSPIAACTMLWRRYIRVARNDPDRPGIGRG